jgi:hypothetical protein
MANSKGFPISPTTIDPEAWTTPSTAWSVIGYSSVRVQLVGSITTPYQPQWSLNGTNFVNCPVYDMLGNRYNTIAAAGIYILPGNCSLRFDSGAGATITRNALA